MANRFPLILDTTDNNKIKEIQSGDNLDLSENSIVGVQNITAIGTINAADIRVNGNRLVAQSFADLTDTPSTFVGSPNYFVKVKADGTGLEFRPLSDLGNIDIDTITVDTGIVPSVNQVGNIGTLSSRFDQVVATNLYGNLRGYNDELVFNAETSKISYAALEGAPRFLSEFTNDVGYLRTVDLDAQIAGLFDEGQQFITDIQGSVFGDDSSILVDAVNSIITGDVLNTNVDTASLTASQVITTSITAQLFEGPFVGDMQIDAGASGVINIGFGVSTSAVNIDKAVIESFDQGTGLGVAQITADTNLEITAGNRVLISGGIPFRVASVTASEQFSIGAENGDVIYNSTTNRLQMFQNGEWLDVNGNVQATAGQSNFNDIVVAGNLTVSGTTTTVDTANTTIKDNVIVLNQGESGAGVTGVTSGIEIDRGSEANKTFVWDDSVDKWTLGSETLVAGSVEANTITASSQINVDSVAMADGATITSIGTLEVGAGTTLDIVSVAGQINLLPLTKVTVDGLLEVANAITAPSITSDLKGSVFGDDSTVIVDAVNNNLNADTLNISTIESAGVLGITPLALVISSQAGISAAAGAGPFSLTSNGSAVYMTGDNGFGSISYNDNDGAIILVTSGLTRIEGAASGNINIGTGTSGTVTLGNGSNTVDFTSGTTVDFTGATISNFSGNVTGNIDNATLTIGATTATSIAIGNSGSTTTINGTVSLPALIAGEITADNSISITTAVGDGNAISIGPQGTNRFIDLTADNIRFFGPITNNINAVAGITGDIKGSVFGDDSTILVDSVNSKIVGPIEASSVNITATSGSVQIQSNGSTVQLRGQSAAGSITYDDADGSILLGTSGNINIINSGGGVTNIGTFAGGGDVTLGNGTNTINFTSGSIINFSNNVVQGLSVNGDVKGSVFADDSSVMVDAVNFTMFSDVLTLTPLNAEPVNIIAGMLVIADGTSWDPGSKAGAVPYPVFYDGVAWNALY